jgi:hypothetical protein
MKMTITIIIIGVTGFIGEALARFFLTKNYRVKGLTRNPAKAEKLKIKGIKPVPWDGHSLTGREKELEGADAVINLSGEKPGICPNPGKSAASAIVSSGAFFCFKNAFRRNGGTIAFIKSTGTTQAFKRSRFYIPVPAPGRGFTGFNKITCPRRPWGSF